MYAGEANPLSSWNDPHANPKGAHNPKKGVIEGKKQISHLNLNVLFKILCFYIFVSNIVHGQKVFFKCINVCNQRYPN